MDIERIATSAIIDRISFCEGLSPFINEGDKEPSWDGHIYIYPNDRKRKSELIARAAVQVKGKKKNIKKTVPVFYFSVEVSDLKNYANEGGTIYFVVVIDDEGTKHIFYANLLPFDLQSILKNVTRQNKKKSIKLQRLPDDNKAIRQIFLLFAADRKRQATQIVWSEEEAIAAAIAGASFKFHIQPKDSARNKHDVMREATTQSFYLYVQTKEGVEIPFAKVEDNDYKIIKQVIDTPVFIGNIKYYDKFCLGYENGESYLYLGDSLRIPFSNHGKAPQRRTFKFTLNGSLCRRIADSDFLLALSQNRKFRIGDYMTHEVIIEKPEEVSNLKKLNLNLKRIRATLDYFGIINDLDMDSLTDVDYNNINHLIWAAEGIAIHFKESNLPRLFYRNMRISNVLVRILAKKNEDNDGYKLFNAFIDDAHVKMEIICHDSEIKMIEPWSLFLHMKSEDFLCSNIDYDVILNSINKMNQSDLKIVINASETENIGANNMLLESIRAYDSQSIKNLKLLQFSIDIANILLDDEDSISIINRFQAIKRQRPLSNAEIALLVGLQNEKGQLDVVKCAIFILLEETENARRLLAKMPEKDKMQITDYPIYALTEAKEATQ